MQPNVSRCRHAESRPARRKVGKTRLLADWQIVPRLGESSARACKGAVLLVAEFWATRLPAVRQGMVKTQNWILIHTAHTCARDGQDTKIGFFKVSPARARGWAAGRFKSTVLVGEIQNCRFGSFAHMREGMGVGTGYLKRVCGFCPPARGDGVTFPSQTFQNAILGPSRRRPI